MYFCSLRSLLLLEGDDGDVGEIYIFEDNSFVVGNGEEGLGLSPVYGGGFDDFLIWGNRKGPS